MSTSAQVIFLNEGTRVALIRRTSDGYPEGPQGMLEGFEKFFAHLEETAVFPTAGQMYARVGWLAAEYVCWCHSVGQRCLVESDDVYNGAYLYMIRSDRRDEDGRPLIDWRD